MAQSWDSFFAPLYEQEYETLFKIAFRITRNAELAQDLVHGAFVLAIFHQQALMKHPKPGAWLGQTLLNLIHNKRRSLAHEEIPLETAAGIPKQEMDLCLEELLPLQLQDGDREVLIWRFSLQMGYQEMSQRLGLPEEACRKRVSRAVERCRKLLMERGT